MRPRVSVDIGGTWLRLRGDDGLLCQPAPSRLHHPDAPVERLVEMLVTTLATHVPPGAAVHLSCGAALDEDRGVAYGSGPLWGGDLPAELPLRELLCAARPDVSWHLINDVTAALADAARRHATASDRHIAYVTISSGVALRTADLRSREILVDAAGLQGEIGHLQATTSAPPPVRDLACLCGGRGHVAAICAGPALPAVAAALGKQWDGPAGLRGGLDAGDPDATAVLGVVVEPIAELVRTMRALDPLLDLVIIGGGVVEGLGEHYERELLDRLTQVRSYVDIDSSRPRVRVCGPGEVDPLAGADAIAAGLLTVRKALVEQMRSA